ncbi:glycogenin-1-like isoform X1 [Lineus longissimus]|uniref:glycogenin-1-like isoform X1 n=1 Tax=Lineus longissimus TaxID=88925 RepID=UPI002B4D2DC5
MAAPQVEDEAFVTLATNDSYCLGAMVLGHSLKHVGTTRKLVVMISPQVSGSIRSQLSGIFDLVVEVDVLDSQDVTNLALLSRPDLGCTFTKFHCWRLTQFSKCVFLDADTLVLQNCDELFERDEFSAAPDAGWPDCFNSGVFVFRPSENTYQSLLSFAVSHGTFDGGDQGLLNLFYSDWSTKDISKHLPFIYNVVSQAFYSYLPAFKQFGKNVKICHFIGEQKPWRYTVDPTSGQVQTDESTVHNQTFLQIWWRYFLSLVHPFLDPTLAKNPEKPLHHLHLPALDPETARRAASRINYKMTMPYVLPDIDVFYNVKEVVSPSGEPVVVDVDEERCYHHYESHYLEEPMSHMDADNPAPSLYDAKDIENIIHKTNGSNTEHCDVENSESGKSDDRHKSCDNGDTNCDKTDDSNSINPDSSKCHDGGHDHSSTHLACCHGNCGTSDEGGIVGQLAGLKLAGPSPEPLPQMNEREWQYAWERGQIDYLGIDSFENIKSKIEDTLGNGAKKPPSAEEEGVKKPASKSKTSSKSSKTGKSKS